MGEYYDWVNVDRKEYICPNADDIIVLESITLAW